MARSLKEGYKTKRLKLIRERAATADKQLLLELKASRLIVEAMDENDLNKVTAIVQKLSSIKTPQLPKLKAAIEQAEAEINKYTAGGPLTKAWSKMKDLVGVDNPIVKVTTFADALEKGFSQIPSILKNNGIDLKNADLSKSLATLLSQETNPTKTGERDDNGSVTTGAGGKPLGGQRADLGMESVQNEAESPNAINGKLKLIVTQLQKALSPGGIFGVFKKVPYINSADLAQELIKAPLNVFSQVSKKIRAGAKASEIAPDLKAQVTGQGNAETKGSEQAAAASASAQSQPSTPTKGTTVSSNTTSTGEQTPQPQGGGSAQNLSKAKSRIIPLLSTLKQNPKNIDNVIKAFLDAGLDPDKLKS